MSLWVQNAILGAKLKFYYEKTIIPPHNLSTIYPQSHQVVRAHSPKKWSIEIGALLKSNFWTKGQSPFKKNLAFEGGVEAKGCVAIISHTALAKKSKMKSVYIKWIGWCPTRRLLAPIWVSWGLLRVDNRARAASGRLPPSPSWRST